MSHNAFTKGYPIDRHAVDKSFDIARAVIEDRAYVREATFQIRMTCSSRRSLPRSSTGQVDTLVEPTVRLDTLPYLREPPYRYRASDSEPQAAQSAVAAGLPTDFGRTTVFQATAAGLLWFVLGAGAMLLLSAAALCALLSREQARRAAVTTALAASDRRLREQIDFMATLLESLPIPVFFKDSDGRYYGCNQAFEALVGRARAEIVGCTVDDLLSPEEAVLDIEKDRQALRLREKQTYESQCRNADGARRHWLVFKAPCPNASNGDGGGLVGVILDMSGRKNAEKSLRNSHQLVTRILNTIPQPIFVKNRSHRFVFLNDAFCDYVGFARRDMLGRSDHDFFPKEEADVFVAKDEQVFTRRVTDLNEETITDASGAEHVILTRKAVFEDEFGEDVLVGVITDITERKRTEEVLRLGAEVFEHSAEGTTRAQSSPSIALSSKLPAIALRKRSAATRIPSALAGTINVSSTRSSLRPTGMAGGKARSSIGARAGKSMSSNKRSAPSGTIWGTFAATSPSWTTSPSARAGRSGCAISPSTTSSPGSPIAPCSATVSNERSSAAIGTEGK
jgi:PAS domain S-box-containing protein